MIKRLLVLTMLLLPLMANASISEKQMQDVKQRICISVGKNVGKIVLEPSNEVNAYGYSLDRRIHVYQGMLDDVQSVDEFAAIYAHELSHFIRGHLGSRSNIEPLLGEKEADELGRQIMVKAGYDPVKAAQFFKRLLENSGVSGGGTHPDNDVRYEFWVTGNPYKR